MLRPCEGSREGSDDFQNKDIQNNNDTAGINNLHLNDLPHSSKLLNDYLTDFDHVANFYSTIGLNDESLREDVSRIAAQDYRRDELVDALIAQNRRFGSGRIGL